ncbi:hypothetical protein GCM10010336_30530 [Streptomyces goshikiensis]|nr:hypothetical protein GCM10010336_30530 [Streptomyces goshikiensis]
MADPAAAVGAIGDQRTEHGIPHRVACRALGVSESWFYKHRSRKPTGREMRRQRLKEAVKEEFAKSGGRARAHRPEGPPPAGADRPGSGRRVRTTSAGTSPPRSPTWSGRAI